jgi:hypothetical protein
MPAALETDRLVARPPRPDDVPALLSLYGSTVVAARMYPDGRPERDVEEFGMPHRLYRRRRPG